MGQLLFLYIDNLPQTLSVFDIQELFQYIDLTKIKNILLERVQTYFSEQRSFFGKRVVMIVMKPLQRVVIILFMKILFFWLHSFAEIIEKTIKFYLKKSWVFSKKSFFWVNIFDCKGSRQLIALKKYQFLRLYTSMLILT